MPRILKVARSLAVVIAVFATVPLLAQSLPSIPPLGLPTGPGRMQLLPGYVSVKPLCFDSDCGKIISSPPGLTINYDIGFAIGKRAFTAKERKKFSWFRDQTTHRQRVQYGLLKDSTSRRIQILFPDDGAFFWADVKNDDEVQTVLKMVLTYKGSTYKE